MIEGVKERTKKREKIWKKSEEGEEEEENKTEKNQGGCRIS
jgi:hypothetical protein